MTILGIDIGSSSVKAAILRGRRVVGGVVHVKYPTRYDSGRAEVDPAAVLKAIAAAVARVGGAARRVDLVALDVMAPAWVALDARGKPLTPLVTHQDRRSFDEAVRIEARVGARRHLRLAGSRPVPGGISSTTFAWYRNHHPEVIRRADLVGHLNTFLHRTMTGERVIDPSNASFTGLYLTLKPGGGWSDELCEAVGVPRRLLPDVVPADRVVGRVTRAAATRFGLTPGVPVTAGCVDTTAAMVLAGATPGQLLNVSGSTDVLALCTDDPVPHPKLLTRALGSGDLWMSVSTVAAAGASLAWVRRQLFADLTDAGFWRLVSRLAGRPAPRGVRFEPHLAGDRAGVEQTRASFAGLTLATTREHMLSAVTESLAKASAARLPLLTSQPVRVSRNVVLSGGTSSGALANLLRRDWPGRWRFRGVENATLRGLAAIDYHER